MRAVPAKSHLLSRLFACFAGNLVRLAFYDALDFPVLDARAERLARLGLRRSANDLTRGSIRSDGVAAGEDVLRREQAQAAGERGELLAAHSKLRGGLEALKPERGLPEAVLPLAQRYFLF